jgi:hypothetical protein
VSGVPAGMSDGFDTTPIYSGTSATLYLGGRRRPPGTYTVTVTGTSGGLTHSQQVAITVT